MKAKPFVCFFLLLSFLNFVVFPLFATTQTITGSYVFEWDSSAGVGKVSVTPSGGGSPVVFYMDSHSSGFWIEWFNYNSYYQDFKDNDGINQNVTLQYNDNWSPDLLIVNSITFF
jgi:hypothetical protein